MVSRPLPCRRRGFTLIELMVVMAIIAVLLTIAAPSYFRHLERAREASLQQTLAVVRDAIDKFHGDTGAYPETLADLASRRYLRAVPVDPITDSAETWLTIPPPPANGAGRVWDIKSGAEGTSTRGTPYADW
ncbi:type II secretion system protein [Rhodocyclus tenuis]|uniref:Type II secretion system protein n=1 Tax=Rhodocyclus gracilis TaxID=2929842 RepID=A0ABX0WG61_9RHOO|nr:type II secretion system protein [Rhodocyclus gracilis]NJA88709.1 type II secretion system protein [Rhodocyclus gracilis]